MITFKESPFWEKELIFIYLNKLSFFEESFTQIET